MLGFEPNKNMLQLESYTYACFIDNLYIYNSQLKLKKQKRTNKSENIMKYL